MAGGQEAREESAGQLQLLQWSGQEKIAWLQKQKWSGSKWSLKRWTEVQEEG